MNVFLNFSLNMFLNIFLIVSFFSIKLFHITCIDSMPLSLTLSCVSGNINAWPSASPLGESLGHTCSNGRPLRGSLATTSADTTTTLIGWLLLPTWPLILLLVPRHNRLSSLNGFCKTKCFFFYFIPKLKKYSFYRISLLGSNFLNVELVNKMFFFTKLKIFFCIFFNIFFFKGLWNVKSFRRLSQRFYFVRDLDTRLAFTRHWTSL